MTKSFAGRTAARRSAMLGVLALTLGGCAKGDGAGGGATGSASAGGMTDMPMQGMGGKASGDSGAMAGMSGVSGMMAGMQTQMDAMMKATPEQMRAMVPAHRQMAANMLAQMTTEMRGMTTPASPAWTATVDSVRQDLVRLPEQSAAQLPDAMKGHHARMTRLMQMHGEMMKGMKM